MNERIRELAEQAGITPGVMGLNRYTHFDPEKFARLIVKDVLECVLYVSRNPHSDMDHDDYTLIRNKVSQRFGVKE